MLRNLRPAAAAITDWSAKPNKLVSYLLEIPSLGGGVIGAGAET
jgi:hypothetical protein